MAELNEPAYVAELRAELAALRQAIYQQLLPLHGTTASQTAAASSNGGGSCGLTRNNT